MPTPQNPTLDDVVRSFLGLSVNGSLIEVTGGPSVGTFSSSHLQGIAFYQGLYLISQNAHGGTRGVLYVFSAATDALVATLPLAPGPTDAYNHPGGIQVIGDYLAVPLQTQDYSASVVQLYDVSGLTGSEPSIELASPDLIPGSNGIGVGGIGLGLVGDRYLAAALDNTEVTLFQSASDDLLSTTFDELYTAPLERYSAQTSILVQTDGTPYVLSFESVSEGPTFRDYGTVYVVDLAARTMPSRAETHFTTHAPAPLAFGVHFRYGAGAVVSGPDALELLATQWHMADSCALNAFA